MFGTAEPRNKMLLFRELWMGKYTETRRILLEEERESVQKTTESSLNPQPYFQTEQILLLELKVSGTRFQIFKCGTNCDPTVARGRGQKGIQVLCWSGPQRTGAVTVLTVRTNLSHGVRKTKMVAKPHPEFFSETH
ncbi:hypothetical protein E5288_WYG004099 [Bos mutus]|uniref:Uncharacterized protein n=1 Tax=Bos mutus TaxID=72004 RepID=A0A6B0R4H0_9CETA|nr:hypothetical protein [Bos mutus]